MKERPKHFLPVELKTGRDNEPIAIRYSLGWTVMGSMGDQKEGRNFSVNFMFANDSHVTQGNLLRDEVSRKKLVKKPEEAER